MRGTCGRGAQRLLLLLATVAAAAGSEVIGKADKVFARLAGLSAGATTALPTGNGQVVELVATTVDHDADGYLALIGEVVGDPDGDFLFKGEADTLYGWVLTKGRAYEYHSEGAKVVAGEVPVEKVRSVSTSSAGGMLDSELLDEEAADDDDDFGIEIGIGAQHRAADASQAMSHETEYRGQDLRRLQSLPWAQKVILLDYSEFFVDPERSDDIRGCSKQALYRAWRVVAAGLSAFEVNVVTDRRVYDSRPVRDTAIACFSANEGQSPAVLNAFGTRRCSKTFFQRSGLMLGRTALHEIGHQLGLLDAGEVNPRVSITDGLKEFKWVPIMGNPWAGAKWGSNALYQWSKGEYERASNKQDELMQIQRYLPQRRDDIPLTVPLWIQGCRVNPFDNHGQIESNTDSDSFTFTIGAEGGSVELRVDRTESRRASMLDIDARLLDASGNVVAASHSSQGLRRARIDKHVGPGQYTLVVRGGAEGSPVRGFSRYSSLGKYAIEGFITGTDADSTPAPLPTPVPRTPTPPTPVPDTPVPPTPVPDTPVPPTPVPDTPVPPTPVPDTPVPPTPVPETPTPTRPPQTREPATPPQSTCAEMIQPSFDCSHAPNCCTEGYVCQRVFLSSQCRRATPDGETDPPRRG